MKTAHQQLREGARKAGKGANSPGGMMRTAHRRQAGH
jgi:hypothetical protein